MRDVEELLRESLADAKHRLDPPAQLYEEIQRRARQRRNRHVGLLGATAVVAVVVTIAAVVAQERPTPSAKRQVAVQPTQPAAPTAPTAPAIGQQAPFDVGKGTTNALAVAPYALYVAQTAPNQLLDVSSAGGTIKTSAATSDEVSGLALDRAAGQLWSWSSIPPVGTDQTTDQASDTTTVRAYDTATLAADGTATVPAYTFSAAALDGELWLATSGGLYVVPAGANGSAAATRVVVGSIFAVTADPANHRVLVGLNAAAAPAGSNSMGSISVAAIDSRTHTVVTTGTALPIGKESIAVVDGQVWAAGYNSGPTPRLIRLDAESLRPVGTSEVNEGVGRSDVLKVGPGAQVWAGGSVLWVRAGGDESVSCVDPHTGNVLEQWSSVQGPVASVVGHAYAASNGSVVQLLLAGTCTG